MLLKNFINIIDKVLILNTTQVDERHQQTYKVIQNKLNTANKTFPY